MLEETGIKAEFKGVLGMRETLNYLYGAADFYFACILKPASESVDIGDTQEVSHAQWVPLDSLANPKEENNIKLFPNAA